MSSPDLSKIVGLIMENPALIEEISALAKSEGETVDREPKERGENENESEPVVAAPVQQSSNRRMRRTRLLGALKEYLSPERARAVDTMVNILDIIDLAGGGNV